MSLVNRLSIALYCAALVGFTGCAGTVPWGPCAPCGPVAFKPTACQPSGNCSDGCGMCEGCGELYIDPWISDPPELCDPCDCCGNYNGQSCGKCRSVFSGVASLWGYRCGDTCTSCTTAACGGGCAPCAGQSCGPSCGPSCNGCSASTDDAELQFAELDEEPTLAQRVTPAVPKPIQVASPTPKRKIFQQRSIIAEAPARIQTY